MKDEVLERIFAHEEIQTIPIGTQSTIVKAVSGVLNNIIAVFDSAFSKLEKEMNRHIKDYNKAADVMLSTVHYEKIGKIGKNKHSNVFYLQFSRRWIIHDKLYRTCRSAHKQQDGGRK